MKKFTLLALVITVISIFTGACAKQKENTSRIKARDLFIKTMALSNKYIDSIGNASDSTILLELIDRYDNSITAINYKYPAGTDYDLAEGENDTLKNLSSRIITLRDSLLKAYSIKTLPSDSINAESPDSIPL